MTRTNLEIGSKRLKLTLGCVLVLVFSLSFFGFSSAQTRPQVVINWSTNSYTPPGFAGKALPSPGASIRANLLVLDNGIVSDISQKEIRWSLDGESYKNGTGMHSIEFTAPNLAGEFIKIRAQVMDFKGNSLAKTIEAPIVKPQAVISTGFSGNEFESTNLTLKAKAFFFNTNNMDSLFFNWKVNRQEPAPSGEPTELVLSLPGIRDGYKTQISLSIENEFPRESATAVKNLIYRK